MASFLGSSSSSNYHQRILGKNRAEVVDDQQATILEDIDLGTPVDDPDDRSSTSDFGGHRSSAARVARLHQLLFNSDSTSFNNNPSSFGSFLKSITAQCLNYSAVKRYFCLSAFLLGICFLFAGCGTSNSSTTSPTGILTGNRQSASSGATTSSSSSSASTSAKNNLQSTRTSSSSSRSLSTTMSPVLPPAGDGATHKNPLLFPGSQLFPPFGEVTPDHVEPGIEEHLQHALKSLEQLETKIKDELAKPTPNLTYAEVALEVEQFDDKLSRAWGVVKHLKSVKDSDALRAVVEKMQPKVIEFGLRMGQSEELYKAWQFLSEQDKKEKTFSKSQARIVEHELLAAKLSGVGLTGEKKVKYNANTKRMGELKTKFTNNLQDATKAFSVKLTKREEVAGLPTSALQLGAQQAKTKGKEESATAEDGPWLFTLDMPSYLPVMQHSTDRELRKKMYQAHLKRASEFSTDLKDEEGKIKDNTPLMEEILKLRQENAELLGYKNYAEVSMAKKMATFESANKLIEDLRSKSYATAVKELEDLEKFAKTEYEKLPFPKDEKLMQWDVPYYAERMKEMKYEFNEEELKPYFSLPKVLSGLWNLANKLFGISIREIASAEEKTKLGVSLWNEDVMVFEIVKDNEVVSYFYLDPFSRPETKKGGAWMDEVCGRTANPELVQGEKKIRLPVAHMVCNQTPPVTSGEKKIPSLMNFREVETLFHEFGHALQHMLTKESEGMAAGIRNVEWDAVEQPSQFMENWCYDKPTVDSMAIHYETGEKLPDALFQKLVKAKNYRAASMMLRQLHFSFVDLELHSRYYTAAGDGSSAEKSDPVKKAEQTMWEVDKKVSDKFDVLPLLPYDRFLCSFAHIFAGGYAAGYFSYKWAEVLSADCFAAFEEVGLQNEKEIEKTGRKFADTVLGLGGGVAPLEVFKEFRGREPTVDALLRHNGLS
ncbi:unnamed protein product [Amoebophrya sp. A120]|nr:unnamed protein product [Amoebophrya sp. A120]|eukprot:GSA120T00015566001.1